MTPSSKSSMAPSSCIVNTSQPEAKEETDSSVREAIFRRFQEIREGYANPDNQKLSPEDRFRVVFHKSFSDVSKTVPHNAL